MIKSSNLLRTAALASFVLAGRLGLPATLPAAETYRGWSDYGGASDSSQYSALNQIDRANVSKLRVAWTYPTGDGNKYSFNPLVAHGLMYVLAKNNSIVALNAATGSEVWIHKTDLQTKLITNRGINYWESRDGTDRRLLFAADNYLEAIDARTGESITHFGKNGRVDLKEGLGRIPSKLTLVQSTTPGRAHARMELGSTEPKLALVRKKGESARRIPIMPPAGSRARAARGPLRFNVPMTAFAVESYAARSAERKEGRDLLESHRSVPEFRQILMTF